MRSERFARPDVRGVYAVFVGGELRRWGVQAGAGG
jgi:hypothetical protein